MGAPLIDGCDEGGEEEEDVAAAARIAAAPQDAEAARVPPVAIGAGIDDATYMEGLRSAPTLLAERDKLAANGPQAAISSTGVYASLDGRLYILERHRWLLVVAGRRAKAAAIAWAHEALGVHYGRDATRVRLSEATWRLLAW
jgi:hypothetical protein